MEARINRYLSERSNEIDNAILSDNDVLIVSPTDSGKTYSIFDFAKRHPHLRIAFIMPTRNLVKNLGRDYKAVAGYGADFVRENYNQRFICTTYDTFLKFTTPFDIVVVDEAHTLAGHGNFRTETLAGVLRAKGKKVYLSGTPEIIENLTGIETIRFTRNQPPKNARIFETTNSAKTNAFNLIQNRNTNNLLLIRINNKGLIDDIFESFKNVVSIAKIYSDSDEVLCAGQDERIVEQVRSGTIPKSLDVLLTTSIIDAGITLSVERDVDCYALSENYMPNPIDVVQLSARVRANSHHVLNLNIIGKFGSFEYGDWGTIQAPTHEQLVQQMSNYYEWYTRFTCESYFGVLNYYNIRCDQYQERDYSIQDAEFLGRLKNVQIVKNLHNFPVQFVELQERFRYNEQQQWMDYFKGDLIIKSDINSQVRRLFEKVNIATDYKIHPSLYLGDSFQEKKLDSLINAVDSFSRSPRLKDIILNMIVNRGSDCYVMDLSEYRNLSNQDQESVRMIAKLIYKDSKHWSNKSHKLKPIEQSPLIELFLSNFNWLLKAVA
jgi:hypothetical protein